MKKKTIENHNDALIHTREYNMQQLLKNMEELHIKIDNMKKKINKLTRFHKKMPKYLLQEGDIEELEA